MVIIIIIERAIYMYNIIPIFGGRSIYVYIYIDIRQTSTVVVLFGNVFWLIFEAIQPSLCDSMRFWEALKRRQIDRAIIIIIIIAYL